MPTFCKTYYNIQPNHVNVHRAELRRAKFSANLTITALLYMPTFNVLFVGQKCIYRGRTDTDRTTPYINTANKKWFMPRNRIKKSTKQRSNTASCFT